MPPGHALPILHREGEGFCCVLERTLDVWGGREHVTLGAGDSPRFG